MYIGSLLEVMNISEAKQESLYDKTFGRAKKKWDNFHMFETDKYGTTVKGAAMRGAATGALFAQAGAMPFLTVPMMVGHAAIDAGLTAYARRNKKKKQ